MIWDELGLIMEIIRKEGEEDEDNSDSMFSILN